MWAHAFAFHLNFAWLQANCASCFVFFFFFLLVFLAHQIMNLFPGQYKCCNYPIVLCCKQREIIVSLGLTEINPNNFYKALFIVSVLNKIIERNKIYFLHSLERKPFCVKLEKRCVGFWFVWVFSVRPLSSRFMLDLILLVLRLWSSHVPFCSLWTKLWFAARLFS